MGAINAVCWRQASCEKVITLNVKIMSWCTSSFKDIQWLLARMGWSNLMREMRPWRVLVLYFTTANNKETDLSFWSSFVSFSHLGHLFATQLIHLYHFPLRSQLINRCCLMLYLYACQCDLFNKWEIKSLDGKSNLECWLLYSETWKLYNPC